MLEEVWLFLFQGVACAACTGELVLEGFECQRYETIDECVILYQLAISLFINLVINLVIDLHSPLISSPSSYQFTFSSSSTLSTLFIDTGVPTR